MSRISEELEKEMKNSFNKYSHLGREEKVVEDFCNKFKNKVYNENGSLIRVRSGFTHRKPMVNLTTPYLGVAKCELGDILFVLKIIEKKQLLVYKASLQQVKISSKSSYDIPIHQWKLYKDFSKISFSFNGKTWNIKPRTKYFANFLISDLADFHIINNRSSFPIGYEINQNPTEVRLKKFVSEYSYLSFYSFITQFMKGKIAENVKHGKMKKFVESLYISCGLLPDPPEKYFEYKEPGGFGIIEITIKRERYE
jgi:hypothetical protein